MVVALHLLNLCVSHPGDRIRLFIYDDEAVCVSFTDIAFQFCFIRQLNFDARVGACPKLANTLFHLLRKTSLFLFFRAGISKPGSSHAKQKRDEHQRHHFPKHLSLPPNSEIPARQKQATCLSKSVDKTAPGAIGKTMLVSKVKTAERYLLQAGRIIRAYGLTD